MFQNCFAVGSDQVRAQIQRKTSESVELQNMLSGKEVYDSCIKAYPKISRHHNFRE
jgi:hypothetical protein